MIDDSKTTTTNGAVKNKSESLRMMDHQKGRVTNNNAKIILLRFVIENLFLTMDTARIDQTSFEKTPSNRNERK